MEKSKIKTRTYSKLSEQQKKQWYKDRYPAYIWQIAYIYEEVVQNRIEMKFDGLNIYFWFTLEYESDNETLEDIQIHIQNNINQAKILDKNCLVSLSRGKDEEFHIKFYWAI